MADTTNSYTSAGTKLYVSATAPATYNKAGFEALSWTEVGEITDLGDFGKQYNTVTFAPINSRKTFKRKGSYNEGAISIQAARVGGDAGQTILLAGLDSDDSYSFKIAHNNIATTSGTVQYFGGQIMSYTTSGISGPDSIVMANINVEIDGSIVEVAPV